MATDEAAQSSTPEDNVTEKTNVNDVSAAVAGDDAAVDPRIWHLWRNFFFFLVARHVLGPFFFVNLISKQSF